MYNCGWCVWVSIRKKFAQYKDTLSVRDHHDRKNKMSRLENA